MRVKQGQKRLTAAAVAFTVATASVAFVGTAAAAAASPMQALVVHGDYEDPDGTPVFTANHRVEVISGHVPTYSCPVPEQNDPAPVAIANTDIVLVPRGGLGPKVVTSISALGGMNLGTSLGVTGRGDGRLLPGTYDIYFDECQDGEYDAHQDAYFDKALRIDVPSDVPDIPLAELKRWAGEAANAIDALRQLNKTRKEAENLSTQLNDFLDEPIGYGVDHVAANARKQVEDFAKDEVVKAVTSYSESLGDYVDEFNPAVPQPGKLLAGQLQQYARLIEKDPPDPEFRQLTPLPSAPARALVQGAGDRNTLLTQQADLAGVASRALLRALERYQGAAVAQDGSWALTHAASLQDIGGVLGQELGEVADGLERPDAAALETDHALELLRQVAASGLSPAQAQLLRNFGVSQQQLEQVMTRLRAAELSVTGVQVAAAEARAAQALRALSAQVDSLAADAADAASILRAAGVGQVPPTVSLRTDGVAPDGGRTLTAVAQVAVGASAALSWDVDGDGIYGDATGSTVTVENSSRPRVVGVEARDADGRAARAHLLLQGQPGTPQFPPATPTPGRTLVTSVGVPLAMDVSTEMPVTWRVDGRTAGTGPTFTFQPDRLSQSGWSSLTATVASPAGPLHLPWRVLVLAADADGDGWRANVDCDDMRADTAPSSGRADDCDPSTAEAGGSLATLITEAVPRRSTVTRHEVFLDRTFAVDTSDGNVVIASNEEGTDPVHVDDELRAEVTRPDGTQRLLVFNYEFRPPTPPLDLSPALLPGRNEVRIILRDTFGVALSSSALWLVNRGAAPSRPGLAVPELALRTTGGSPVSAGLTTTAGADPSVTYMLDEQPQQGSATITGDQVTYTPNAGASGRDRFTYRARSTSADGSTTVSAPATIDVAVDPASEASPPRLAAAPPLAVPVGGSGSRRVTASGTGPIVLTAAGVPPFATFIDHGDGTGALLADRVPAGTAGSYIVQLTAASAAGADTSELVLQVTGNQRPRTHDLQLSTPYGTPVQGQLDATDPDGDTLSVVLRTPPTSGTVTMLKQGFTYTPAHGSSGRDGFLIDVSDGQLTVTVTITVTVAAPTKNANIDFLAPVSKGDPTYIAEAGRTIPFRWRVQGPDGEVVRDPAAIQRYGFTTPGATSSLRVDGAAFHDNVQTPKSWAGQRHTYLVQLMSGETRSVIVEFKPR